MGDTDASTGTAAAKVDSSAGTAHAPQTAEKRKVSDKEVDLSQVNRGVWLVKVPKYISDRWKTSAPKKEVGKLHIARRTGQKPQVSFSLDDEVIKAINDGKDPRSGGTRQEIPKEHKFVVSPLNMQSLVVFSHEQRSSSDGKESQDRLALEGKVVQRAECRPISSSVYMSLKKEALLLAMEPARQTKKVDRVVNAYKPVSNHAANIAYDLKKKEEGKKSRADREQVMDMLFALFEKHQYYNIKDLVRETRQPFAYLKEILNEVCHYSMRNPHKNMWELKAEYRHYKSDKDDEEKTPAKKGDDSSSSSSDEDWGLPTRMTLNNVDR